MLDYTLPVWWEGGGETGGVAEVGEITCLLLSSHPPGFCPCLPLMCLCKKPQEAMGYPVIQSKAGEEQVMDFRAMNLRPPLGTGVALIL
jgi:hypothetical protein